MSTRSTLAYWDDEAIGREVHIYREMHDEWIYIEIVQQHVPGSDSYALDCIKMRLFPDTTSNRSAFGLVAQSSSNG